MDFPSEPPHLEIEASPARRWFAVGAFYLLGGLTVWLAGTAPASLSGTVTLAAVGALALVAGEALRRGTERRIVLDAAGLSDTSGAVLAPWDQIVRVERGPFALKPSNGFVVLCRTRQKRGWVPGLWWRVGRRVGVGGVLPMHATKRMAEEIALRLAAKDGQGLP